MKACRAYTRHAGGAVRAGNFPNWLYCLSAVVLFSLLAGCQTAQPPEKVPGQRLPNVVIIFTDDQGYQDVGCFGSPNIQTPNLDRMAAEGMKLTSFYAAPVS